MISKKKIFLVLGTRPEAIKLIPLYYKLKKEFQTFIISTGQHSEAIKPIFNFFEVSPHIDLNLLKSSKTLDSISSNAIKKLSELYEKESPDMVIVQGDTITAFIAAFSAFLQKIPVAHVEAGLRTNDKYSPFPEEINRQLISRIAELHFAPTLLPSSNLEKEGIEESKIFITGNTVIDSLLIANEKLKKKSKFFLKNGIKSEKIILVTCHRRENFGAPLKRILNAIASLAKSYKEYTFVFPVHPNPNINEIAKNMLKEIKNIYLTEPLDYSDLVEVMGKSKVIITDSGGIQEEAPSLGVPIIVTRESTERPEGVENGNAVLVGSNKGMIIKTFQDMIRKETSENYMYNINPYGDGKASEKILKIIKSFFNGQK